MARLLLCFRLALLGAALFTFAMAVAPPGAGPELQLEIQQAYQNGYLKDPKVSAEVLNYRPFYILGEVMKPGTYPFENGLTVLKAVATAEGFTYRANTKRVYIKRPEETDEHEYPLTSTTLVAPGDTIRIGERFF